MTQQEMLDFLRRKIDELETRQGTLQDIMLLLIDSQKKIALGASPDPRQEASDNLRAVMGLMDIFMFDNPPGGGHA